MKESEDSGGVTFMTQEDMENCSRNDIGKQRTGIGGRHEGTEGPTEVEVSCCEPGDCKIIPPTSLFSRINDVS